MTKAFILFNSFHFSYTYFQATKIASNLEQFGVGHEENCRCASGSYSKFGMLGTNFQHPGPRQQTCFLSSLTAENSVLRSFSVRSICDRSIVLNMF